MNTWQILWVTCGFFAVLGCIMHERSRTEWAGSPGIVSMLWLSLFLIGPLGLFSVLKVFTEIADMHTEESFFDPTEVVTEWRAFFLTTAVVAVIFGIGFFLVPFLYTWTRSLIG